eukprot:scaffold238082_cov27-Tisochrysis_lutea.AAC.2
MGHVASNIRESRNETARSSPNFGERRRGVGTFGEGSGDCPDEQEHVVESDTSLLGLLSGRLWELWLLSTNCCVVRGSRMK